MITQTDVVSKFASLIGTKPSSKEAPPPASLAKVDPNDATSRELLLCISKSVAPDTVVCTLPSLDMRKLEKDSVASPLPDVGKHFPKMEASVLHNATEGAQKVAQVEQKAAQSLGTLSSWTRSSVVYASKTIADNVANSFTSLVESRRKAWTLLLLRHSLTGDVSSRARYLSMQESTIKVDSAEIEFKPVPMSPAVANTAKSEGDPDVILPMIAEVILSIAVNSKMTTVTLRAPGTISAHFDRTDDDKVGLGLTTVDIGLDTGNLLDSMVYHSRMVVFHAVSKATDSNMPKKGEGMKPGGPSPRSPGMKSGFNSSLRLSPSQARIASSLKLPGVREGQHQPAHRTMKAHNSSLKLNKVLSSATIQNSRSVQFGTLDLKAKGLGPGPGVEDDFSKRQKLQTTNRLTSFKSFGRPHAGDFGSDGGPKNATFANFGGSKQYWGRDGKLSSRPRPQLPSETTDMLTSQSRRNANATFDTKPPIHLSRSTGLGLPKKKSSQSSGTSMHRTATAAEGWLLENMKKL
eukprot:CAMPEP_0116141898 /NCGR_PEP_ID=MMETSP0329-20121206/14621_1 /TAXON_ID=697910 /ORGANISM="Pseudo-nitzschia arenysensis, Strain B593" /LENGTH=519 /DNA_ID=CAMNT_0003637099 /DNA_START=97 /DNA_END=1656 /DNA_ORIENTATION=+